MLKPVKRKAFRRHYLTEWLTAKDMTVMDLLRLLNDSATEDEGIVDKSQVYRWIKGQLPHGPTAIRIASVLNLKDASGNPDPELLLAHPSQAWLAARTKDLDGDEANRLRGIVENAFPRKKA